MRLKLVVSPQDIKNLRWVQKMAPGVTLEELCQEAIDFYFKIYWLIDSGYQVGIKGLDGKVKYFSLKPGKSKRKPPEEPNLD